MATDREDRPHRSSSVFLRISERTLLDVNEKNSHAKQQITVNLAHVYIPKEFVNFFVQLLALDKRELYGADALCQCRSLAQAGFAIRRNPIAGVSFGSVVHEK